MNREKFREMYDLLMEQLDVSRELSDDEILGVIDELILTQARELFLSLKEKVELRQELFCSVRKLDVLQELIDDESVTKHHRRMCTVFKKTCSGKIFYCDRWRYRQWKNNIPWSCYRIYSKR